MASSYAELLLPVVYSDGDNPVILVRHLGVNMLFLQLLLLFIPDDDEERTEVPMVEILWQEYFLVQGLPTLDYLNGVLFMIGFVLDENFNPDISTL